MWTIARKGADVLVAYLDEDEDAQETAKWVEDAGQKVELFRGDVSNGEVCRSLVKKATDVFGRIDVLVNNAAFQMSHPTLGVWC